MRVDGIKLTSYFAERRRTGGVFVADALTDAYARHGIQAGVLLRGAASFGPRRQLHTDRSLTLSESLPAVSVAVDSRERVLELLPEVLSRANEELVSLERALVLMAPDSPRPSCRPGSARAPSS